MNLKSEATFDTLYIGSRIEQRLDDFSHSEIHFLSYLACLLSLYDGNPLFYWKYSFVKTKLGSPYSNDIKRALDFLKSSFSFDQSTEGYFKLTEKGRKNIEFYLELHIIKQRLKYLDAACQSITLMPVGLINKAIQKDPIISSARISKSNKFLLEEASPALHSLYEQFELIREALKEGNYKELLIPAVIWIESLRKQEKVQLPI